MAIRIWWAWGRGHWLLARRNRTTGELAYYVCHGPRRATLAQLAAVAGARWAIEECFQQAKQTCGLDDYQVRHYRAWYAHITLAILAYAALTGVCEQTNGAAAEPGPGMIALTVPEVRRLLVALLHRWHPSAFVWAWSVWRRRRQYQARRCHYRRHGHPQVPLQC